MLCTCSSWQPCAAGGGDSPRPLSVSRTRLISTRWVFRPVSITPSVLPISVVRKLCWRSVCIIKGIRTRPLSSGAAERGDARNHASDWPLAHVMFMRRCHGAKVVWKKVLRSVETKIELGIKRSIWQNPPEWSVVVVASCFALPLTSGFSLMFCGPPPPPPGRGVFMLCSLHVLKTNWTVFKICSWSSSCCLS